MNASSRLGESDSVKDYTKYASMVEQIKSAKDLDEDMVEIDVHELSAASDNRERTILRLESEINNHKRSRKEDHERIAKLKTIVKELSSEIGEQAKRQRVREETPALPQGCVAINAATLASTVYTAHSLAVELARERELAVAMKRSFHKMTNQVNERLVPRCLVC